MTTHILKIGKRYYYNRRVPLDIKEFDPREYVRVSLKTDSLKEATKKAAIYDKKTEAYWNDLIRTGKSHESGKFQQVIKTARLLGFNYKTADELAGTDLDNLIQRISTVAKSKSSKRVVESVLGGVERKKILLSEIPDIFWAITKNRVMNKSEDQIRKWRNPRKRAFKNFINLIGDKEVSFLERDDLIAFRDWWIERIQSENLAKNSANKELHCLKNMIEAVNEHERLNLDTSWLFSKISLIDRDTKTRRKSFDSDFIIKNFLQPRSLLELNDEARAIVQILAETGARPKEICSLEQEDIILDHKVPHIKIRFKKTQELKTPYSERDIPLIGLSLKILREFQNGFTKYRFKADTLSGTVNKFLKNNNLIPSKDHTLYSLRHSFQDRMTQVNMPDRVQCELFGHKFSRPEYGAGPSLSLKKEWLERIQLVK